MKYGSLTYNPENIDRPFTGKIACRVITARLEIRTEKKRSPDAPDYAVWAKEGEAPAYQLGSAWNKEKDGKKFLSITLDSPDFIDALNVTGFPVQGNPSEYEIVWQRPRQQKKGKAVDTAQEGDGFQ